MSKIFPCNIGFGNIKVAELKGSWRESEAWHHEKDQSPQRKAKKPLVKMQSPLYWRPKIQDISVLCMGRPPKTTASVERTSCVLMDYFLDC